MKMGSRLALGKIGSHAPPEQEAIYYRKLARHMATCAMDVVHTHGLAALCRLMYNQEGSPKCTREDGGAVVEYRTVASNLWERIKQSEQESGKVGGRRGAISGHPMSVCKRTWMEAWNNIVYASPLVDSWPFRRGETKYSTPSVEKMYVEKVRRQPLGRLQYFWPQAASAARPFTSDLVAPASRRNSLLPAGGRGSTGQGAPGSGAGRQRSSLPAGGTGPTGQGSPGSGGIRRSSLLPESSSSTCSPGPQPSVPPKPVPVTVRLTRQQQFDQALMQACHGIARCVRIAMQGLGEQRREPLSEDSLVAAYTVGRHFAESMRIPMQESSDVILRCAPFSPKIPRNHLGYLHAGVRVVNNAWTDDAGEEAMELLLEAMA